MIVRLKSYGWQKGKIMTLEILWNSGAKQILENIYKITEYELDNDRRLMFENENTIERQDNNLGYSPNNCRWATFKEQANNKRSNHIVNIEGVKMTISQCSEKYGIAKSTVRWRTNHNRDILTGVKMDEVM